jgi:hypothetical protein
LVVVPNVPNNPLVSDGVKVYRFKVDTGVTTLYADLKDVNNDPIFANDIAMTETKFWLYNTSNPNIIHEYNITRLLNPWTYSYNRKITADVNLGKGLAAKNNTTLIGGGYTLDSNNVSTIYEFDISGSQAIKKDLFDLPGGGSIVEGDLYYNKQNGVIYVVYYRIINDPNNPGQQILESNIGMFDPNKSGANKLVRNYTLPFSGALTIFVDRGRLFIVENQEGTKNVVYRIDWVTLAPTLFNVNVGLTDLFRGGAESDDCRKILCNELVKSQDYGNYGFPIEFEIQLDRLVGGTVNFKYTSADKPTRFILSFDGQLVVDTGYVGAPIYGHKVPPQTTERDLFTTSLNGKIDPITGNFYPNSSTTDPAPDNFPNINQTTLKSFIKNSSTSTLVVRVYAPLDQTIWSFEVSCPIPPTPTPTRTKVIPSLTPTPTRTNPNPDKCTECDNNVQFTGTTEYGKKFCIDIENNGLVEFYFETYVNPDRFIVEYEGEIIGDTGYVGLEANAGGTGGYGRGGTFSTSWQGGVLNKPEPITNIVYPNILARDTYKSPPNDNSVGYPVIHGFSYTPEQIQGKAMPLINVRSGRSNCDFCLYKKNPNDPCRDNGLPQDRCGSFSFIKNGTSKTINVYAYGPEGSTKWFFRMKCPQPYKCDQFVYPNKDFNCYYSTYTISGDTIPGLVRFDSNSKNTPVRFILRGNDKSLVIDTGYIGDLKYNIGGSERNIFNTSLVGKLDPYLNQNYPIAYDAQNPRHIKIASDGYPIVYATNEFEEYFYKKDNQPITAYVDIFDPLCQYDWEFIVLCPCELDCFDEPTPPDPSISVTPLNSITPTPTITKSITSTPSVTPTVGLSPTPTRTQTQQLDCFECSTVQYAGGQAYPASYCFNIGTNINQVVPLTFNTINYPDRYIVKFDNNFVIDTGYVGATGYGYGEPLRGDFIVTLLGKIDPITGLDYPDINIPNTEIDGYPIVFGSRVSSATFVKDTSTNIAYVEVYAPMLTTQWSFSLGCGVNNPDELIQNLVLSPTLTPMPSVTPTLTQTNNPYANICRVFSAGRDLTGNNNCSVACQSNSEIYGKYLNFNSTIGSVYYANKTACETNSQFAWGFERIFVVNNVCYRINDSGAIVSSSLCSPLDPSLTPTPTITQTPSNNYSSIVLGVSLTGVYRIYFDENLSGTTETVKLINLPNNQYTDIAMSSTKIWLNSILNNSIDEYNVTLSPWTYAYNRTINISNIPSIGNGLAYKTSNKLISGNQGIYEIDITTNNGISTLLFMLPGNGSNIVSEVNGDIYYDSQNNSYIVIYNTIYRDSGAIEHFIGEFSSIGVLLNRVSLDRSDFYSIFAKSQNLYVVTSTNEIFRLTTSFELTYFGLMDDISLRGATNLGDALIPTPQPTVSTSKTPLPTRTITRTITPTKTPTRTVTRTITPTISITPTITPTISITPTITTTISLTPTISNTRPFVPSFCSNCQPAANWQQYSANCCYFVQTSGATYPSLSMYSTTPSKSTEYSIYGARFYNDGFTKDGRGEISYFSNTFDVWANNYGQNDFGPMNRSGVWSNNMDNNRWIGFSIPLNGDVYGKKYWIGIGSEKNFKILLNGVELINTTEYPATYPTTGDSFKYWHVYPIVIYSGLNVIEVYGLNDSNYGSFACEIYDADVSDLINAAAVNELNIIFSTINKSTFDLVQTLSNAYTSNGYMCSTNFTYVSTTNSCQKIVTCCEQPVVSPTPTISLTMTKSVMLSATPSRTLPIYYPSSLNIVLDSGLCDSWGLTPFTDKDSACETYSTCFSASTASSTVVIYMSNYKVPQTPVIGDILYKSNGVKLQSGWYIANDDLSNNTNLIFVNSNGVLSYSEFCVESKIAKGQNNNSCNSLVYDNINIYYSYNYDTSISKVFRSQINAQMGVYDWNGWYPYIVMDGKVITIDFDGIVIYSDVC